MNKFLRTSPTRRMLGAVLGLLLAAGAGTTIAIAATGGGPVPRRVPLAVAIHRELAARAPAGISARITFVNNLIDSNEVQGSDPLLNGGSGRLWLSPGRLRLEIQGDNGDAQLVVNRRSFWAYDPAFKTVYEGRLPPRPHDDRDHDAGRLPSIAQIQSALNRLARRVRIGGAVPGDVGGQPAYSVRVSPRHDNGLLGGAELAWDALHRVPLRFGIYARGNPNPVLGLVANDISFGPQSPDIFSISPPAGAKVVKVMSVHTGHGKLDSQTRERERPITGVSAVRRHLPFALHAPRTLAGRPLAAARLLSFSSHPAALVAYGRGVGTIIVLEQRATHPRIPHVTEGDGPGLSLPSISIHDSSGQQLQTAIGTLVRFTRDGVSYTVLGSVDASTADAAARGL